MARLLLLALVSAFALSLQTPARAQDFKVEPYLQWATPTSMHISWETAWSSDTVVEWGTTEKLGNVTRGKATRSYLLNFHHTVKLEGLTPDTRYFYRVRTLTQKSRVFDFRTPALTRSEKPVRIVALADMQYDRKQPRKFREIVERGILPFVVGKARPSDRIDMVLIAGDLVRDGRFSWTFRSEFFAPIHKLARHVPIYPVLGNHEENDPAYFRYFTLPDNGLSHQREHMWWLDQGNVRVVGFDSNVNYRTEEQLAWLRRVFDDACQREPIDFVIATAHHPARSELWPAGEAEYSRRVAQHLEDMARRCQKPSLLVTGHAHGYARGHSGEDHALTLLGVGSAGGRVTGSRRSLRVDYPDIVVSEADYGFVVLEATAGREPTLTITRVSRGTPNHPRDNEVRDRAVLRRHKTPSTAPVAQDDARPRVLDKRKAPTLRASADEGASTP